ncbi:MAG: DNA polymerase III subunit beta [Candidatus Omnitrophota bacterium]
MKFQTDKTTLLKGTQVVQNIVSTKGVFPILSNILLETKKDKLHLIGADIDIGIAIQSIIPINTQDEGSITIPAKKFSEIIKELPNAQISISVKKNNIMTIECEKCHFKLLGMPKDEFPKIPDFSKKEGVVFEQSKLKHMLNLTSFAMSRDETRYELNSILFDIQEDKIRLVATDGRRLAMIEEKIQTPKEFIKQLIIPNKTVQELNRILADEGEVKILFGENQIAFELDSTTITTRLIDGEYPPYEQVMPKDEKFKLRVNKEALSAAIKRMSLYITQDSLCVKFDLFKNKLVLSKNTQDLGEAKEELEVIYADKEFTIGFNPIFILDVLKELKKDEVVFEITDSEKPAVIREPGYVYIVLPMHIA